MRTGASTFLSLLERAQQIVAWNVQVIEALPANNQLTAEDAGTRKYLRGRRRIFRDFAEAGQKVVAALQRSGSLLLFQLQTEVQRLEDLTLHEVEELHAFLLNRSSHVQIAEPMLAYLIRVLAQTAAEIRLINHRPRFS